MTRRHARVATLLAAMVAVLSITGSAFAAIGASIKVAPTAELRVEGAAVTLTVGVVCGPFDRSEFQSVGVQVTQRVGNQIASGFGFTSDVACDGTLQQVRVSAAVSADSQPFAPGVAFAQANLQASGQSGEEFVSQSASSEAEIVIS